MWGTVARMRAKSGQAQAFTDLNSAELEARRPAGLVNTTVYQSASDPQEFWMAVVFESEQAYRANADQPEQDAWYRRMRDLLESDPEWHDGEIVYSA